MLCINCARLPWCHVTGQPHMCTNRAYTHSFIHHPHTVLRSLSSWCVTCPWTYHPTLGLSTFKEPNGCSKWCLSQTTDRMNFTTVEIGWLSNTNYLKFGGKISPDSPHEGSFAGSPWGQCVISLESAEDSCNTASFIKRASRDAISWYTLHTTIHCFTTGKTFIQSACVQTHTRADSFVTLFVTYIGQRVKQVSLGAQTDLGVYARLDCLALFRPVQVEDFSCFQHRLEIQCMRNHSPRRTSILRELHRCILNRGPIPFVM